MSASRRFSSIADYLQPVPNRPTYGGAGVYQTFAAWVRHGTVLGKNSICGNKTHTVNQNDCGLDFSILAGSPDTEIELGWASNGSAWNRAAVIPGFALNTKVFVCATFQTPTGTAPTVRLFSGLTSATVAEIGVAVTAGGPVDAGSTTQPLYIGLSNDSSFGLVNSFLGDICSFGWWAGGAPLTLAEMKVFAAGGIPQPTLSQLIYFMEGVSPEPDSGQFDDDATVHGTVIVDGFCAEPVPPSGPGDGSIPIIPKPPRISGGPGGALDIPTLGFDQGTTGGDVQAGGVARTLEAPQYGGYVKKPAGRKVGMLQQRLSPSYRGLNHLASTLEKRRK